MERRSLLQIVGTAATGGVTILAGCSRSSNKNGDTGSTTDIQESNSNSGGSDRASNTVQMVTEGDNHYFDPIGLFVGSGDTVAFKLQSGAHSATAYKGGNKLVSETRFPEDAKAFTSKTLTKQGATYTHTFQEPGTYDYFCIPHKSQGMVGRIVVGEPGGPAEGSMPPDGDVPESQIITNQNSVSYSHFNR
ncbi:halocyanin [Natrinema sp. CBA1119]|nr:halocyanin [Natrinema sp. CBA1119]